MTSTIKAIETEYAGCRFRSRLEARWAVFFDRLGIEWEHEPDGFETSAGRYLPDFRIRVPDDYWYPYWFEVKPDGHVYDARHRALASESGMPLIVAKGMPRSYADQCRREVSPLRAWFSSGSDPCAFVGPAGPGRFMFFDDQWDTIHKGRTWNCEARDDTHVALYSQGVFTPGASREVDAAYQAARSARFGT